MTGRPWLWKRASACRPCERPCPTQDPPAFPTQTREHTQPAPHVPAHTVPKSSPVPMGTALQRSCGEQGPCAVLRGHRSGEQTLSTPSTAGQGSPAAPADQRWSQTWSSRAARAARTASRCSRGQTAPRGHGRTWHHHHHVGIVLSTDPVSRAGGTGAAARLGRQD